MDDCELVRKHYKLRCTEAKAAVGGGGMSKGAINFSKDNEYYTPKQIMEMFGSFEYDPATTKEKAEEFGVKAYDTIETDGLKTDWTLYNSIWCNPPFTIKHEFLKKAQDYFDRTGGGCVYANSYRVSDNKTLPRHMQGGDNILAKWAYKVRERIRTQLKKPSVRERSYKAGEAMEHTTYRHIGDKLWQIN